jgi:hypothetical protein
MRKSFAVAVGASAMLLSSLLAGAAIAQTTSTTQTTKTVESGTMDTIGPHNPYCGAWTDGAWTPNGNCVTETTTTTTTTQAAPSTSTQVVAVPVSGRVAEHISGKITAVNGHMITMQQGDHTLIVDDSRALSREDTGKVATGRAVVAHGYWEDGVFYANRFD